jgi:hypothetical protein
MKPCLVVCASIGSMFPHLTYRHFHRFSQFLRVFYRNHSVSDVRRCARPRQTRARLAVSARRYIPCLFVYTPFGSSFPTPNSSSSQSFPRICEQSHSTLHALRTGISAFERRHRADSGFVVRGCVSWWDLMDFPNVFTLFRALPCHVFEFAPSLCAAWLFDHALGAPMRGASRRRRAGSDMVARRCA